MVIHGEGGEYVPENPLDSYFCHIYTFKIFTK